MLASQQYQQRVEAANVDGGLEEDEPPTVRAKLPSTLRRRRGRRQILEETTASSHRGAVLLP